MNIKKTEFPRRSLRRSAAKNFWDSRKAGSQYLKGIDYGMFISKKNEDKYLNDVLTIITNQ